MARIVRTRHRSLFVLACLIASACASFSGWTQGKDPNIVVPETVRQPSTLDARLAQHYHLFVSILEASGLKVGQTDDPRALVLEVGMDRNPSVETVVASLWHQDKQIISIRAEAPGGIGVRSNLIEPMAQRAAQKFESQLGKIRDSIVILGDDDQSE